MVCLLTHSRLPGSCHWLATLLWSDRRGIAHPLTADHQLIHNISTQMSCLLRPPGRGYLGSWTCPDPVANVLCPLMPTHPLVRSSKPLSQFLIATALNGNIVIHFIIDHTNGLYCYYYFHLVLFKAWPRTSFLLFSTTVLMKMCLINRVQVKGNYV